MVTRSLTGVDVVKTTTASITSGAPAPPGDSTDRNMLIVTALAAAATISAPTGTPIDGNSLLIRIKDNGAARALTWDAIYRVMSGVTLPTTTVVGKDHYIGCAYNSAAAKWDVLSVAVSP